MPKAPAMECACAATAGSYLGGMVRLWCQGTLEVKEVGVAIEAGPLLTPTVFAIAICQASMK